MNKKDKRVLVYTSDKHYILAYESDMKDNGVSHGCYINDGYGKYARKDLQTTLKRLSGMKLYRTMDYKAKPSFDGTVLKEIPFYKDIKLAAPDEYGNGYKYTFIKNITLQ